MIAKKTIRKRIEMHRGNLMFYVAESGKALEFEDYSLAATMAHRAHQQVKMIAALEGLL